jgi:hypothetical protein
LLSNGGTLNLGALFNPAGAQDLSFEFHVASNAASTTGIVMYGPLLAGDFNRDGSVNAADYVLWRKMDGQHVARGIGADGNGDGTVDVTDYGLWQSNFGRTSTGAGSGFSENGLGAVPEPCAALLFILSCIGILTAPCRSRKRAD